MRRQYLSELVTLGAEVLFAMASRTKGCGVFQGVSTILRQWRYMMNFEVIGGILPAEKFGCARRHLAVPVCPR
tara:strand:- start:190 stop:408 length:219 start_codon:yes stop_codon:yes gene_type:complete